MNNRCKIQLVVSRYNENLDWLCAINDIDIFIHLWKYIMTPYNKHNIAMKSMINQEFKYCKKLEYWK